MSTKMKLLEDIAIHTNNGMELIPEGTTISEMPRYDLDRGGVETTPGMVEEDPRKSEMLQIIDEFSSSLDQATRMRFVDVLGGAADAIESGDLAKLKNLAGAYARRGDPSETGLVNMLRQLAAMGRFLGESFVDAINSLIKCIKG
jgi:hypothetical protein